MYTKLFHACVCPVLVYAAGLWGFQAHKECKQVQNKAIGYSLGSEYVFSNHIVAVTGDPGWEPCEVCWAVCMTVEQTDFHW